MGALFVISGPSGVGKGTLVKLVMQKDDSLSFSISCTTRAPRSGETDGKDYFFISRGEFEARIKDNDFLEWDEHFNNLYGTPKSFVLEQLKTKSVILEIDVKGALAAKKALENSQTQPVLIMVAPPSEEALKERLRARGSESEEELNRRIERAQYELSYSNCYDYVLVNDRLDEAEERLRQIIENEKNKRRC